MKKVSITFLFWLLFNSGFAIADCIDMPYNLALIEKEGSIYLISRPQENVESYIVIINNITKDSKAWNDQLYFLLEYIQDSNQISIRATNENCESESVEIKLTRDIGECDTRYELSSNNGYENNIDYTRNILDIVDEDCNDDDGGGFCFIGALNNEHSN